MSKIKLQRAFKRITGHVHQTGFCVRTCQGFRYVRKRHQIRAVGIGLLFEWIAQHERGPVAGTPLLRDARVKLHHVAVVDFSLLDIGDVGGVRDDFQL